MYLTLNWGIMTVFKDKIISEAKYMLGCKRKNKIGLSPLYYAAKDFYDKKS